MVSGKEQNVKQQLNEKASGTSQSQHCNGATHTSSRKKKWPHVNGNGCSSKSTTNRGRDSASRRSKDNMTGLTNGREGKVNGEGCSPSAIPQLSDLNSASKLSKTLKEIVNFSSSRDFLNKKSNFVNDDLHSDASNKQSDDDSTLSSDSNSSNTTIQSQVPQTTKTRIRNEDSGQSNQIVSRTEKELISYEWPKMNSLGEATQTVNSTANPNELHKLSNSSVIDLATELSVECNVNGDANLPVDSVAADADPNLPVDSVAADAGPNLPVDFVVADAGPISDENPVAMLESLGAANCDNLQSSDSGINASQCIEYQFKISSLDVGRLIGHRGKIINKFRRESGAEIFVTEALDDEPNAQLCVLTGTRHQIDYALHLITVHFPKDRYPHFNTKVVTVKPLTLTCSSSLQLSLPHTTSFQACLSAAHSPSEFFIQLPNQYYYHITKLRESMTNWYDTKLDAPGLSFVQIGNICVARVGNLWYRAKVIDICPDAGTCRVVLLDFGGYTGLPLSELRQINGLFMQMPFQAILCSIARVMPANGVMWTPEAVESFEMLSLGRILTASIAGFTENGIPCLDLYASLSGYNDTFINHRLVQQGHARLNPMEEINLQMAQEINLQMVQEINLQMVQEINCQRAEGVSNSEIVKGASNSEMAEGASNSEIIEGASNPRVAEEVSHSQTAEGASNPQAAEGASNPQAVKELSS